MKMNKNKTLPFRAGVVGCGGIAQVFHIPILFKHPEVHLQALCDIDISKAAVIADKYNDPHVYSDIADMLNKENLDVIFILTPNNLHLPMSLIALEHGVNVFIEKPAARNYSEVKRIYEKARVLEQSVMVGMHNRFRPDVQAIRKLLNDKELGGLFYLKAGWLQAKHHSIRQAWHFKKSVSGGGVVMDLGIQLIDLAYWLLGNPHPSDIRGFITNIEKDHDVEDTCVVNIFFKNNVLFTMEASWDFPIFEDRFYLEIAGMKGTGTLNPLRLQKLWHGQIVNITPELKGTKYAHFKKGYENEVNHFINYLSGRVSDLESSIKSVLQVHQIVDHIYDSFKK